MCPSEPISSIKKRQKLFLKVNNEIGNTVQIDARDNEGNTPLHLATLCENENTIEPLLRRGAGPCLANAKGLTPVLITARRDVDGFVMELFLGTNDRRQRMVGIDARDDKGRTAREWAVTRCWPLTVSSLLDRGTDVSGFVFPTPSDSDRYGYINPGLFDSLDDEDSYNDDSDYDDHGRSLPE
ncbi:hypothetical protein TKK_0017915 [Trichogramma kaykai]